MNRKKLLLAGLVVLVQFLLGTPDSQAGNRGSKKIGVGVGLLTEPFPSLIGYTLAYNLNDNLRLTAGYGSISSTASNASFDITTIGVDAKYFLLDWSFTPFISAGVSSITGTVSGTGSTSGISISGTGVIPAAGFGIDWQSWIGFNLGVDYKIALSSNANHVGIPGIYFGWYF